MPDNQCTTEHFSVKFILRQLGGQDIGTLGQLVKSYKPMDIHQPLLLLPKEEKRKCKKISITVL